MEIGLLFAGQGAQHSGMGKSLYDNMSSAKKVVELAGAEIEDWCFNGTKEMLRQTQITQPCIYTVTMAAYESFIEKLSTLSEREQGAINLVGVAGFSLGEYAALTASGVIDSIEKGLKIVKNRGRWMSEAGMDENGQPMGGMTAVFGDRDKILKCVEISREEGILEGVNFNSPAQTVVAGDKASLERLKAYIKMKAKEGEHLKAVPLSVSTAFHSTMMLPAVPKLMQLLMDSELKEPDIKVYSNVTGKDMKARFSKENGANDKKTVGIKIAELMGEQARSPVYWQETIENMQKDGVEVFIELGPGNILSGLVKKINKDAITMNISDYENLNETISKIKFLLEKEAKGEPLREEGDGLC